MKKKSGFKSHFLQLLNSQKRKEKKSRFKSHFLQLLNYQKRKEKRIGVLLWIPTQISHAKHTRFLSNKHELLHFFISKFPSIMFSKIWMSGTVVPTLHHYT